MNESDDRDRDDIIQLLRELSFTGTLCVVKVFITSCQINCLNSLAKVGKVIRLHEVNQEDISKFSSSSLGPELNLSSSLARQVVECVVKKSQGVFIWVQLVIRKILEYQENGCSEQDIFDLLEELPTTLNEYYRCILAELEKGEERDIRDRRRIFRFVLFAYRPLRLTELRDAFAIPGDLDVEFLLNDELFEKKLIGNFDERLIVCGGNFLETKDVQGTAFPGVIQ
jgi:hypothetical protein